MPWTCQLCGDHTRDITDLVNHLRLMHPDVEREVQWPRADRFDDHREAMTSAVERYVQHSTVIELIESSVRHHIEEERGNNPQPVGGKITPLDYDLGKALGDNLAYQLAKSRRDAARRAVVMWGVAAQVEAEAARRER